MKTNLRISQRLIQVLLIQAAIISMTALLGVYAARYVIGDILIQRALDDEATHYWELYVDDPNTPLPNTYNLTGYMLSDDKALPEKFSNFDIGLNKFNKSESDYYIVHVSENYGKQLFLEFDGDQVSELALFFGIFPLTVFLIVIYLSGWIAYRLISQALSPVVKLANILEELDPLSEEFSEKLKQALSENENQEVMVLSDALYNLSERIQEFVIRERNFTRDASHELRSPITVIKIAADYLLADNELNEVQRKPLLRIKNNASDMEELIEALLILARESDNALSFEPVCINDVCQEEIERTQNVLSEKPINVSYQYRNQLYVTTSDKVLSILIGNLIRNAFSYTDEGSVTVKVDGDELTIEDSGIGMPEKELEQVFKPFQRGNHKQRGGYGVGLTIVKMLTERFNWPINIESQLGYGTSVTINFPEGELK
ncbi:MAG: sensor histidine kinase [Gammaproteobacteria bacterium]|jgi:signal transduction histidine kinase